MVLESKNGLFVIGATNRPDLLDPSLLRPGRFDKMIYLGISEDKSSRMKILEAQTRKFNLGKDVDLDELESKVPKNFTGADFYALTSGSILKAAKRKINELDERYESDKRSGKETNNFEKWLRDNLSEEEKKVQVMMQDFLDSLAELKPSVTEAEIEKYKSIKGKFNA